MSRVQERREDLSIPGWVTAAEEADGYLHVYRSVLLPAGHHVMNPVHRYLEGFNCVSRSVEPNAQMMHGYVDHTTWEPRRPRTCFPGITQC